MTHPLDPHPSRADLAAEAQAEADAFRDEALAALGRLGLSWADTTGEDRARRVVYVAGSAAIAERIMATEETAVLTVEPQAQGGALVTVEVPGPVRVVASHLSAIIPADAWADDDTPDGPAPTVDADASGRTLRGLVTDRRIDPEARLAVQHLATLAASPTGRLDPDALAILRAAVAVLGGRS